MSALNHVAAATAPVNSGIGENQQIVKNLESASPMGKKGEEERKKETEFDKAEEAVATVISAFHKQEDEELSARLCRKNVQVMDRLAKMQAHERESILIISDSYGR